MNKLKHATIRYSILIIISIAAIIYGTFLSDNTFWNGFGFGMLAVSIMRLFQIIKCFKSPEYLEHIQITNHDERNLYLSTKAKSIAFHVIIVFNVIAILILEILHYGEYASFAGLSVGVALISYCICYLYAQKRN